ncbi:MAG: NFACT family protein [Candidatus Micrarchaeota archaeon]|nr:NFACT family protein [Candidatus Micrarchaeota archaeon]MDE1847114.1 NFACT family protein [Candidatus Micrarchaeota archaeon]
MRQIASIELHAILKELQPLTGMYLKKFYDLGGSFRMLFTSSSASSMLYIRLLQAINLTEIAEEVDNPTNFATAIRKRIAGKKLTSISQHYSDRIVVMEFGEERFRLIIEMFGKGNLILTDSEYTILLAYEIVKQKNRTITPHERYQFPEGKKFSIDDITEQRISEVLDGASADEDRIIKYLSSNLDIGPIYLENILTKVNIDPKSKSSQLISKPALIRSFTDFLSAAKTPSPVIYSKDGKYVDYSIVPISKYEILEKKSLPTVSKMLEEFYLGARTSLQRDQKEIEEINSNIQRQKELLEEEMKAEKEDAEAGHKIFANMQSINQIIEYINQKRRVTAEEVQEKFGISVKSLDLKNKSIRIEI